LAKRLIYNSVSISGNVLDTTVDLFEITALSFLGTALWRPVFCLKDTEKQAFAVAVSVAEKGAISMPPFVF